MNMVLIKDGAVFSTYLFLTSAYALSIDIISKNVPNQKRNRRERFYHQKIQHRHTNSDNNIIMIDMLFTETDETVETIESRKRV